MKPYLSIDVGGTYIKSALFDYWQNMYKRQRIKTTNNEARPIVDELKRLIDHAIVTENIRAVGISTSGIVDREKGKIIYAGATIPNYTGTSLKENLTSATGLPVIIENDVNAALLGEVWKGAGREKNQTYCITLGTGIGGSYYHSHIVDGYYLQADAVGYLLYDKKTKTNYEMRASTSALKEIIQTELGINISTKEIFLRAKKGDSQAIAILESWAKEVASGLAQIILIRDPACLIIGGGISAQGSILLDFIQDELKAFLPPGFLKTELKIAQLQNDAALYGAVYPFFQQQEENEC